MTGTQPAALLLDLDGTLVGYRLAYERLDVPANSAVAVEDSPAGVLPALGADVGVVYAVSTTHAAGELTAAGPVEVFPDLQELARRFGA